MVEILKLMLNRDSEIFKICVRTCDMSSTLGSDMPVAMFLFLFWGHGRGHPFFRGNVGILFQPTCPRPPPPPKKLENVVFVIWVYLKEIFSPLYPSLFVPPFMRCRVYQANNQQLKTMQDQPVCDGEHRTFGKLIAQLEERC